MKFHITEYLKELEHLVNIDSGSSCLEGVAEIGEYIAGKFAAMGWQVQRQDIDSAIGPCFEIKNTDEDCFDVLLLGHTDTVFPAGTAAQRPFSIQEGKAYGPGVVDMKASLLSVYYTLQTLQTEGKLDHIKVCLALNSEEELGSRRTRSWLESLARCSRLALVLEPARANGDLVLLRKGLGRYQIEFHGVAAHAGVDPQNGISAIGELGCWITELHALTDIAAGITVNVGIVSGGSAANVVADYAKAEVDFRVIDVQQTKNIESAVAELLLHAKTAGVKVDISGGMNRPPMRPGEETATLCRLAEEIGSSLGITVGWAQTGGGSDGNFTAALGVPTLDGVGPIGGKAHGVDEYLLIDSVEPRIRFLSELIVKAAAQRDN